VILTAVALLMSFPYGINAQPIAVDGDPADWTSPTWQALSDPVNDVEVDGIHPHDAPKYARSGYDLSGLWAHFDSGTWYFRLDTDGRPGDADSRTGIPGNLGIGLSSYEVGPLSTQDANGIAPPEEYSLWFRYQPTGGYEFGGTLRGGGGNPTFLLPGVAYVLQDEVTWTGAWGSGAYGDNYTPGIIEFACPVANLFPAGTCREQFWVGAHIGSSQDRVSEDEFNPVLVQALAFALARSHLPATPTAGQTVTFYLDWSVTNGADLMNSISARNLTVVEEVDSDLTYVDGSCAGGPPGTTCSYDDGAGELTWIFPSTTPPGNGQLQYQAIAGSGEVLNRATMTSDQGLCAQATEGFAPLCVTLSSFTATPAGSSILIQWDSTTEIDNLGFNLYRANSEDGPREQLNENLIPSQAPGSSVGATYSFLDESVAPGTTTYYWLEDVDTRGISTVHGPVSAATHPSNLYRVFLPNIVR
jgi:hypothetical protein